MSDVEKVQNKCKNIVDISPVWSSLGIEGGAELSDRLDRLSSSPVGTDCDTGGGVTADS